MRGTRRPFLRTVMLATSLLLLSCGGGGGGGGGDPDPTPGDRTVELRGTFAGGSQALVLSEVAQVFAFYSGGGWDSAPVTSGVVRLDLRVGQFVAIVFADASGGFLGYLALPHGLDSLPLAGVDDALTAIELGTLSSIGSVVTPSINPLPTQLGLSTSDQIALGLEDDAFTSVARNPDADNDGVIDALQNRAFRLNTTYFIHGGNFDTATTPMVHAPVSVDGWNLTFTAWDNGNEPVNVTFNGPPASGIVNVVATGIPTGNASLLYWTPNMSGPTAPPGGTYTVGYGSETLTFTIPDQGYLPSRVVVPVPTATVSSGVLGKIDWTYRLGDGSGGISNPASLLRSVEVQVQGSGTPCGSPLPTQPGRMYNSGNLPPTPASHTFACSVIWGTASTINMTYQDHCYNQYVVSFDRP